MDQLVELHNNEPVTTSLKVAEVFGKRHDNVLRDIETLLSTLKESKDLLKIEEMSIWFIEVKVKDAYGREQTAYEMTKDGFALLAMGFTGPKALQFKMNYINAFNKLEKHLKYYQDKEMQRLRNCEANLEKNEDYYTEADHFRNNTLPSLQAELKNLRQQVADLQDDVTALKATSKSKAYASVEREMSTATNNLLMRKLFDIDQTLKSRFDQDAKIDAVLDSIKKEVDKILH